MGSGASAGHPKDENPTNDDDDDDEDHGMAENDTRSLPWRRAWRALLDYHWSEDDLDFEEHPETNACEKVKLCIKNHSYEARSALGFLSGRSLLHLAAERGAEMSCIELLEAGALANIPDKYMDTPLHCAAKEGRLAIVRILLEFGGDPLLKNKHEKTPMQWAEDFDQSGAAKILKDGGGDPVVDPVLPPEVTADLLDDLMLTVKQVVSYHEAFTLFDEDGSGELGTEELGNVIRSIGFQVSEAEVVDMVEDSDADRSGALDFIEFLELMAVRFGAVTNELTDEEIEKSKNTLKDALREFDKDDSGTLSYEEYMNAMMRYGEPLTDSQAQEILTNLDVDEAEVMEVDYDKLADVLSSK